MTLSTVADWPSWAIYLWGWAFGLWAGYFIWGRK